MTCHHSVSVYHHYWQFAIDEEVPVYQCNLYASVCYLDCYPHPQSSDVFSCLDHTLLGSEESLGEQRDHYSDPLEGREDPVKEGYRDLGA